ncbi:putative rhamnogalacturonate lyase B [Dorcoceras hygrometricum]|uniref:Putative rhamnogalacturonate lyase B n=1 Tax=Dorcoceras hygrometricum TaxID=472368 RepID=A0A2Z7AMG0_9LAMI|nr:putative rhamnogalacturonate lyase B [Dorcoceras hygrometricum]
MDQVDTQLTLGLLTRRIEPSWLRTKKLGVKRTSREQTNQMMSVRNLIPQIYQPAGWKPAGNGAKLEPRSSSRARKNRTSSAADKKRRRCRSCSRTRLKMKSNQLDEETS